ncbi:hypothetical protein O181_012483 [Austropuccinia psidii MF-1]|uniref:Uncharacterized protein n=1 Tax=Austropuccinia psidii MF-1 TaxID=1389203 RepID=A0A9Q3BXD3_9BASI|nr:hypothetical protein [Austropuccinia psidii MF-1]
MYCNVNHKGGTLELSGRNLQQYWHTYKHKFMETTQGLGVSKDVCGNLQAEIESRCLCFNQIIMMFGRKQNVAGHNVYDTSMVMNGKDEEGNFDVNNNLSQCGSDTNNNGSVTAKAKEPTGTRSEAQKRYDHSELDNRNEGRHI